MEYQLRIIIVDSVMGGRDLYWISTKDRMITRTIPALTMLDVLKVIAEYFNTSTDYLIGLTDRMY